jgi:hypothetical protein
MKKPMTPANDNGLPLSRADAKARGLRHYFTGQPCPRGHRAPRFVSDRKCAACSTEKRDTRRAANWDAVLKTARAYYHANKDKVDTYRRAYRERCPHILQAARQFRRAAQISATPPWLTKQHRKQIAQIYKEARRLTKMTGIPYHVDHIVPLTNPLVCGLHVPWNLRAIPANDNLQKSNKFNPDTA